ncbi:hypothetical protein ABIC27_002649 [Streptomyces sp. PvR034]
MARSGMTNVTSRRTRVSAPGTGATGKWNPAREPHPTRGSDSHHNRNRPGGGTRTRSCYASGRTTALIGIEPAPAIVMLRPVRGACTIAPSPMYMPTWLASSK